MYRDMLVELYDKNIIEKNFNSAVFLENLLLSNHIHPKELEIDKKQNLVESGVHNESIYFIRRGIVSSSLGFMGKGRFLGLDTLAMNDKPLYTIKTIEPCELYVFDKLEVMEYLFSLQEGWLFLYLIEKEERNLLLKNHSFLTLKGLERMEAVLIDLAQDFGVREDDMVILPKSFSKKLIAEYANLSVNTITILIKELKKEQFLKTKTANNLFYINGSKVPMK